MWVLLTCRVTSCPGLQGQRVFLGREVLELETGQAWANQGGRSPY